MGNKNNKVRAFWIGLFTIIFVIAIISCSIGITTQSYLNNLRFNDTLKEQYYRGMYDVCIQTDLTITECKRLVRGIAVKVNPYESKSIDWTWPIEDK